MVFRRKPEEPVSPVFSPQWESLINGRPPVEQAVIRAALTAHQLVDPQAAPPSPQNLVEAEQRYRLAQLPLHGMAFSLDGLRASQLLADLQPLYDFLLTTMGSSQPSQQFVADLLVTEAEAAGEQDHAFRPWLPLALLVRAAHLTQGGRAVDALAAVDESIGQLRRLRRRDAAARDAVRAAAEGTRLALTTAIAEQPMSEQRRTELDDASYDLDRQGRELCGRDEFDRANVCFDHAMALLDEWYEAFPDDARAIRAVATTLGNRLLSRTEGAQFAAAVPDGRRAQSLFESLRSPLFVGRSEATAAEAQARLALALAGAGAEGELELAGPELLEAVIQHGTASIEIAERAAEDDRNGSKLGRVLALYAKAQRLLADEDLAPEEVALAAEAQALEFCRSHLEQLGPHDRRHFAEVAFAHALAQLDEDHEAARDAAADFLAQSLQLLQIGLQVVPGADQGTRLEMAGYAEYMLCRSKLALGDSSFGQHIVNAQYILDQHPGPLAEPMAKVKREIDEFIANRRREEASRGAGPAPEG